MSDITATLRVASADLALTETVERDGTATIRPVTGSGTVPDAETYLFAVDAEDFARFETAVERDSTVEAFDRVIELGSERLYSFSYTPGATLFSPAIAAVNGISLEWTNGETAWTVRVWLPDRAALAELWEHAAERDIEIPLERVTDHTAPVGTDDGLTRNQRRRCVSPCGWGTSRSRANRRSATSPRSWISPSPLPADSSGRGIRRLVASTVTLEPEDE